MDRFASLKDLATELAARKAGPAIGARSFSPLFGWEETGTLPKWKKHKTSWYPYSKLSNLDDLALDKGHHPRSFGAISAIFVGDLEGSGALLPQLEAAVDGRNPFRTTVQNAGNDDSPVKTDKHWFPLVSK